MKVERKVWVAATPTEAFAKLSDVKVLASLLTGLMDWTATDEPNRFRTVFRAGPAPLGGEIELEFWPESGTVSDHFQLTRPMTATAGEPILLITRCAAPVGLADFYASVEPLGPFQVWSGPSTIRNYYGFKLNGRKPVALSRIC